jgi:iron(III) transport system permease protein
VSPAAPAAILDAPAAGAVRPRPRAPRWLPAVALTVLLGLLILPPIFSVLRTSVSGDDAGRGWTMAGYIALFTGGTLYSAAWNSIRFACFATLLSLANGGALAWLVERTDAPLKPLAAVTTIVSLGTPYIIYVTAWLYLLGRTGPINALYRTTFHVSGTLTDVYSISGMVFIEGLLWSPLVFLLLSATFRAANADMEEAARTCGASVAATIWRISLRLALPAIIGVGLFVFIRNLEAFDVPVLVGMPGRIDLLTTSIYLDMTRAPPLLGHASAFSTVLMVVVAGLLFLYSRIIRHADRYASVTGKGFRPRPFRLGRRGRGLGAGLILLNFTIVLVLPMLAILWNSFSPFVQPMTLAGVSRLSLKHYAAVFAQSSYLTLALNTVLISGLAAVAAMALTAIAAWMSVRRKPGSMFLDQITSVPLVFPGIVLGVAVLEIALRWAPALYGSIPLVALAFVIRYLPYGMRYCVSGVMQVHRELEEAAGAAGADQLGTLRRIVLPLLSPSLIAGGLFIFLLGAKELSIAVLLAGPNSETISVAMFDQYTNGASGEVAAMGVLWTVAMTVVTLSLFTLTRKRGGILAGKAA